MFLNFARITYEVKFIKPIASFKYIKKFFSKDVKFFNKDNIIINEKLEKFKKCSSFSDVVRLDKFS